jgi:hypothetical protein
MGTGVEIAMRWAVRIFLRTAAAIGLAAGVLAWAGPAWAQTGGGGGGGSRGGGGSMGGSGSGSSSSSAQPATGISNTDTGVTGLNSFANVGTGTTGRGSSQSAVSSSNFLAAYYVNPYAQGLSVSTTSSQSMSLTPFGSAVYANVSSGSGYGGSSGGGFGGASLSGTANRSSFSGTSLGASGSYGGGGSMGGVGTSTSRAGGAGGFGGTASTFGGGIGGVGGLSGLGGLGGTATTRPGGTTGIITFAGGSWGPTIGRTGPVVSASIGFRGQPSIPAPVVRRDDLRQVITRSTVLRTPGAIDVMMDGNTVVLRGRVASADDRRIAENMLRLTPGVRNVRNELEVQTGSP